MRGHLKRPIFAATLMLVCMGALGQMNKCVDANGKVSYQEHACAGARPAPAPTPTVKPAVAQKQETAPREAAAGGAPLMPNHAAKECVENWQSLKVWTEQQNREIAKVSEPGRRVEMKNYAAGRMTDFLRPCKRVGFITADKPEQWRQNDDLAAKLAAEYKTAYERRIAWETEQSAKAPQVVSVTTSRNAALPPTRPGPELSASEQAMSDCAETWNISGTTRYSRREFLKEQRARGKGQSASSEADEQRRDQADGVRFLAQCEKFGFIWPKDDAGETRNSKLVDQIRAKVEAQREERRNADAKYELDRQVERRKRDMADGADRRVQEKRNPDSGCNKAAAELAQYRAMVNGLPPATRHEQLPQLERAEREWRANCN